MLTLVRRGRGDGVFQALPRPESQEVETLRVLFLCPSALCVHGCSAIVGMHAGLFCHSPVSGILFLPVTKCDEQLFQPLHTMDEGLSALVQDCEHLDVSLSSPACSVGLDKLLTFPLPRSSSL